MKEIAKMKKTIAALVFAPVVAIAAERPWANAEELAEFVGFNSAKMTKDESGRKVRRFYVNAEKTVWRDVNFDERFVGPYTLEDPLAFADGRKVETPSDWAERRAEILRIFESEVYGPAAKAGDHGRGEDRRGGDH